VIKIYATNLQFAQMSGLGLRIVDENVGTGTGSLAYFDLDNYNIVAGSYALSYAAAGSNDFTALTETTHYTIPDLESGRIILTAAGMVALGTNVLYATYWYTDDFSDTVVTSMLSIADEEVDKLTGRKWETPALYVEYRNGRKSSTYPTTDRPYQEDWDAPDFIVLNNFPVTKIDRVYFLDIPLEVSKFYNYDDSGVSYTDYTSAVNSSTIAPFIAFAATPAAADIIYVGSSNVFMGLDINLGTNGTGSPAITWEYYNGTAWASLTVTETDTDSSKLKAGGKFTWSYPYGWSTTSVNSSSNYYWVRGRLTSGYTIAPQIATITLKDSVSQVLEPRNLIFRTSGILNFIGINIPDGTNNIRIDYYCGESSVPSYISELNVLIAAVKGFVNLTGGSYDSATSYNLGSKSVTIGEQYVNIREVLVQYRKRIDDILQMVGKRADVKVI